jgi:dTDP-L-rhamnose 4-epimerase
MRILVIGGAGFIGSHLTDQLLNDGHSVRILDALVPQVHGPSCRRPTYLNPDVELLVGDVRDGEAVRSALQGVDAVYHLAAAVGVGQSMYQFAEYTSVNNLGTAVLLQALMSNAIERLIVASSMSLYGEGLYRRADNTTVGGVERSDEQLRLGDWEVRDEKGEALIPVPTPESKRPSLQSVYALSKYDQERLCLLFGRAYGVPTVALRFFNVYGPRQALSNPYTGIMAIFGSRLLNNQPPFITEDGNQQRDFVSVHDIARACRLALVAQQAPGHAINIGSGRPTSVREVAARMAQALGKQNIGVDIAGKYRRGDIRHCFADISLARTLLGYEPTVSFEQGLIDLIDWQRGQTAVDQVAQAQTELLQRGLLR